VRPSCAGYATRPRTLTPPRHDSKPKTAIPLAVGIFALTKLVTWTINAMLGLDPDIAF
jgi:hypothetical protein